MNDSRAADTVRSPAWLAAAGVLLVPLAYFYFPLLAYSFREWLKPDYSHGFLVPLFSAYLLWRWRDAAPESVRWPDARGLLLLTAGAALFLVAGATNFAKEWLQGLSLVLNLCGLVLLLGGLPALKWAWPAVAFLIFMFPLPWSAEHMLGSQLQKVAAVGATYLLEMAGYPTYREGVVIIAGTERLEVERACNGLSMLLTFVALSTAMAMVVRRPWPDRVLILAAAVPIAILSNVVRIAATGVLFNAAAGGAARWVFHDAAGWLMMVFALAVLMAMLKVLDWVLVADQDTASREDVLRKNSVNPAYLFMQGAAAPAALKPPPQPAKATGVNR